MIETVEDMVDVFSKSTAKLQERIAELEQENERLRENIQNYVDTGFDEFLQAALEEKESSDE